MSAKKEAEGVTEAEFEWDGNTYTVPASLDLLDLDALEAVVDGNAIAGLRALLGPAQWALLKKREAGRPHRFVEINAAVLAVIGDPSGESEPSSD